MRYLALLLPLSLLVVSTACQKPETRIVVQKVEVPVPVPCPAAPPRRPLNLPVSTLPPDATPQTKAQALKASFLELLGRLEEDEAVLDGYRQKDPAK